MKKNVVIIAILAGLMLTGCNNTEKIEDNNKHARKSEYEHTSPATKPSWKSKTKPIKGAQKRKEYR